VVVRRGRGERHDAGLRESGGLRRASSSAAVCRSARRASRPTASGAETARTSSVPLAPAFQPAAIAPAFGAALESTGVTWIHGRLTYRRVYDTGSSNVTEFASGLYAPASYDGGRISSERIGYSMDANLATLGGVKAGVVYDFYNAEMTNLYATIDAYAGKKVTLSADYDYYVPTYDADSIWNFFAGEPMSDLGLRANVNVTDRLSVAGGGHVRVSEVQTGPLDPGRPAPRTRPTPTTPPTRASTPPTATPSTRAATSPPAGNRRDAGDPARQRQLGREGDRVGADIAAQHVFETRYVASLRTGVWQWDDKLEPDRSTTSFNYVLGLGYRFAQRSQGAHRVGARHERPRGAALPADAVADRGGDEMISALRVLLRVAADRDAARRARSRSRWRSSPSSAVVPLALAEATPPAPLHGLAPLPNDQEVPHAAPPARLVLDPTTGPSDVIFPAQHITLRFNHATSHRQGDGAHLQDLPQQGVRHEPPCRTS
jgi:hypothetical protein